MLAAAHRLKHFRDIGAVQRRGRFAGGSDITGKALRNGLPRSRAVIVVGKKVSKKAVVRNTIRRKLAAILATEWATVAPGYDIVLTVRADLSKTSAPDLTKSLQATINRLNLK